MDYDLVYPPKGQIKLDGGLNTKYDKYLIEDNEIASAANCVYMGNGIETRGGITKLNTVSVGSYACDGLFTRHDRAQTETMCVFFGGLLYTWTGSTMSTVPSAQSVFTAGVDVVAEEQENYIFFGNGSTPYKYDGTYFTRHGIPAASAPTVVSGSGTGLTGDYRWKVSFVNSALVEGDVSAGTTTLTVSNQNATLTIPTAPASYGVLYRNVYRTTGGGSVYKRVAQITNNTATTFVDAVADASLGVNAPDDQGEPPNYSVIKYHKGRLFTNDTGNLNYITYSELETPYVFKSGNFETVGDNTGDTVRDIQVFDDGVYILCTNSSWMIYMPDTDDTTWVKIRVKSPYGSRSPLGAVFYNDKLMYPAIDDTILVGFATVSGSSASPSVTLLTTMGIVSDRISDRIEPEIFNINDGLISKICSIIYKNSIYISVPDGGSATENNRIYVYDFSRNRLEKRQEGSWMPWTGINAARFTIYGSKLYCGDSTATGFVHEMNTQTYSDNGTAINSYVWTKEFQGLAGEEQYSKDFRKINMVVGLTGSYNIEMRYRTDSDQGLGNQDLIDVTAATTNWGFTWGSANWSAGNTNKEIKEFLGSSRGKSIQFKFSNLNTAGQKFRLLGFKFEYNRKGKR